MKNHWTWLKWFAVVVGVGLLLSRLLSLESSPKRAGQREQPGQVPSESSPPESESEAQFPFPRFTLPLPPSPTPSSLVPHDWAEQLLEVQALLPTRAQVREEVERDPHSTPASLVRFAQSVGRLMEVAKSNDELALQLMSELQNCVGQDVAIESARAFCLNQSARLASFFPQQKQLQEQALRIRESAPAEVKRIANSVGNFHDDRQSG